MFLAQHLSELVAVVHGESAQRHGDLHHIFLIDHDPMRFGQHLIKQRMQVRYTVVRALVAQTPPRTYSRLDE